MNTWGLRMKLILLFQSDYYIYFKINLKIMINKKDELVK